MPQFVKTRAATLLSSHSESVNATIRGFRSTKNKQKKRINIIIKIKTKNNEYLLVSSSKNELMPELDGGFIGSRATSCQLGNGVPYCVALIQNVR